MGTPSGLEDPGIAGVVFFFALVVEGASSPRIFDFLEGLTGCSSGSDNPNPGRSGFLEALLTEESGLFGVGMVLDLFFNGSSSSESVKRRDASPGGEACSFLEGGGGGFCFDFSSLSSLIRSIRLRHQSDGGSTPWSIVGTGGTEKLGLASVADLGETSDPFGGTWVEVSSNDADVFFLGILSAIMTSGAMTTGCFSPSFFFVGDIFSLRAAFGMLGRSLLFFSKLARAAKSVS